MQIACVMQIVHAMALSAPDLCHTLDVAPIDGHPKGAPGTHAVVSTVCEVSAGSTSGTVMPGRLRHLAGKYCRAGGLALVVQLLEEAPRPLV